MQSHGSDSRQARASAAAFGEFLLSQRVLRAESLRQALDAHHTMGGRLDTVLLDLGLASESTLLYALGAFHASRTVSADELAHVPPEVARMVSPRMAERLELVPFRLEGRTLHVANLSPDDPLIEDELSLLTDCMISSFVALEVRVYQALERIYGVQPSIQVCSVLKKLQDRSATPIFGEGASEPGPTGQPAPRLQIGPATDSQASLGGEPTGSEDSLALEISQEDLDQFPSLRSEPLAARGVVAQLHGRPPDESVPAGPEERLRRASTALQNAEMREDIADALLEFCAPILRRRLLLVVRGEAVVGWRGEGEGIDPSAVRKISIPLDEPSVFVGLAQGSEFWLGPLPRMARNHDLVRGLGGVPPNECIILPLIVRSKSVCFLYGDNVDQTVTGMPITQLRRLVAKASLAFQVYILKSKIRNL